MIKDCPAITALARAAKGISWVTTFSAVDSAVFLKIKKQSLTLASPGLGPNQGGRALLRKTVLSQGPSWEALSNLET